MVSDEPSRTGDQKLSRALIPEDNHAAPLAISRSSSNSRNRVAQCDVALLDTRGFGVRDEQKRGSQASIAGFPIAAKQPQRSSIPISRAARSAQNDILRSAGKW